MCVADEPLEEFTSRHSLEWKFLFLDHRFVRRRKPYLSWVLFKCFCMGLAPRGRLKSSRSMVEKVSLAVGTVVPSCGEGLCPDLLVPALLAIGSYIQSDTLARDVFGMVPTQAISVSQLARNKCGERNSPISFTAL